MHNRRKLEIRATAKSLAEQRAETLKEMEALLNTAKTENRAMTEDELKKLEEYEKSIEAIDKSVEAEKRAMSKFKQPEKETEKDPEPTPENRATETPSGIILSKENRAFVPEADKRAFMNILSTLNSEHRAGEQNFTMGNNGALIPTSIANRLITEVKAICPIFARCDLYHVKGNLRIPVYGPKTVEGAEHNITVGYQEEFTELVADAGAFGSINLSGFLVGALTLISRSLINNSEINAFDRIITEMAKAIKRWFERELLRGTSGKCTGALSTTNIVKAGSTTTIAADTLIDLQCAIPTDYQDDACWTMNPDTFKLLRKLKDSTGQYLLQQYSGIANSFPYQILGKPVYLSDNMPKIESGAKAILYGDYTGLSVNVREDIEMEVLREKYATQHAIGVCAWFEIDSKVSDNQKLAALEMSVVS